MSICTIPVCIVQMCGVCTYAFAVNMCVLVCTFISLVIMRIYDVIYDGCLQAKMKDFEEMGWFEILMFYGFREGYDTMTSNDDDNAHLIPSLVERAVLPLVTSLVENVWEVMSSRQTKRLSQLVSRLMEDYPTVSTDSKNTEVCVCVV